MNEERSHPSIRTAQTERGTVVALMRSMAGDIVRGAQVLAEQNAQNQARFERQCRESGLDPSGAAAALLRPPEVTLGSCRVEASVQLASRGMRQTAIGVMLGGRLTHSFYQARFETGSARRSRVALEVQATPDVRRMSTQAKENSQDGLNGSADESA